MKKQIALSITVPDMVCSACSQKLYDSALLRTTNVRLWKEPYKGLNSQKIIQR